MMEYTEYCDMEAKDTEYAIKTASRQLEDLQAIIEDSTAKIAEEEDAISSLGTAIASKETELSEASGERQTEHTDFVAAEKDILDTIDEMSRAEMTIKKEMSLLQGLSKG